MAAKVVPTSSSPELGKRREDWFRICVALKSKNDTDRASAARLSANVALAGNEVLRVQALLALAQRLTVEPCLEAREAACRSFQQILVATPTLAQARSPVPFFVDACYRVLLRSDDRKGADGGGASDQIAFVVCAMLLQVGLWPSASTSGNIAAAALEALDFADDEGRETARDVLVALLGREPAILSVDWCETVLKRLAACASSELCPWLLEGLGAAKGVETIAFAHALSVDVLEQCSQRASFCNGFTDPHSHDDPDAGDVDTSDAKLVSKLTVSALRLSTRLAEGVPGLALQQVARLAAVADTAADDAVFSMALRCLRVMAKSSPYRTDSQKWPLAFARPWAWLQRVMKGRTRFACKSRNRVKNRRFERELVAAISVCSASLQKTQSPSSDSLQVCSVVDAATCVSAYDIQKLGNPHAATTVSAVRKCDAGAWRDSFMGLVGRKTQPGQAASQVAKRNTDTGCMEQSLAHQFSTGSGPSVPEARHDSELTARIRGILRETKETATTATTCTALVELCLDGCALGELTLLREALTLLEQHSMSFWYAKNTNTQHPRLVVLPSIDRRRALTWLRRRVEWRVTRLLKQSGGPEDVSWFFEFAGRCGQSSLSTPSCPFAGWVCAAMIMALAKTHPQELLVRSTRSDAQHCPWSMSTVLSPWVLQCWTALFCAARAVRNDSSQADLRKQLEGCFFEHVDRCFTLSANGVGHVDKLLNLRLLFRCGALAASYGLCEQANYIVARLSPHVKVKRTRQMLAELGGALLSSANRFTTEAITSSSNFDDPAWRRASRPVQAHLSEASTLKRVLLAQRRLRRCCSRLLHFLQSAHIVPIANGGTFPRQFIADEFRAIGDEFNGLARNLLSEPPDSSRKAVWARQLGESKCSTWRPRRLPSYPFAETRFLMQTSAQSAASIARRLDTSAAAQEVNRERISKRRLQDQPSALRAVRRRRDDERGEEESFSKYGHAPRGDMAHRLLLGDEQPLRANRHCAFRAELYAEAVLFPHRVCVLRLAGELTGTGRSQLATQSLFRRWNHTRFTVWASVGEDQGSGSDDAIDQWSTERKVDQDISEISSSQRFLAVRVILPMSPSGGIGQRVLGFGDHLHIEARVCDIVGDTLAHASAHTTVGPS